MARTAPVEQFPSSTSDLKGSSSIEAVRSAFAPSILPCVPRELTSPWLSVDVSVSPNSTFRCCMQSSRRRAWQRMRQCSRNYQKLFHSCMTNGKSVFTLTHFSFLIRRRIFTYNTLTQIPADRMNELSLPLFIEVRFQRLLVQQQSWRNSPHAPHEARRASDPSLFLHHKAMIHSQTPPSLPLSSVSSQQSSSTTSKKKESFSQPVTPRGKDKFSFSDVPLAGDGDVVC